MKKISKSFILFNIMIFSIISCTDFSKIGQDTGDNNFERPPEMEFYGFRRESYVTNFKQMDMFATNAKFYDSKALIELYDSRNYTYDADGTIAARVSGEFAKINKNTLYTEIFTNVVAKASNNSTLYTEYVQYDHEKSHFKSPVPIRVEQEDGSWLTGSSMEGDLAMENITVYNEKDEGDAIGVPIAEE
ncbi:LPS export ABC transporter periplasmic protein LptC [Brachyspira pilosicoli]|uniref:LPS export ABC transporter periplasmic protein LptC n=1 Tax=Brachyspira pilosicoli TaxID=52584 RepID=UPI0012F4CAC7|nr:LPS export ABC transporter periplasmic protein LptC [Brachyspira pilosicoli]